MGRASLEAIARVLALMADPPNARRAPRAGDLPGAFDVWFDGGAFKIDTGVNTFRFPDGTVAYTVTCFLLSVDIVFPDGTRVQVGEVSRPTA